jgi:hypothetical protein
MAKYIVVYKSNEAKDWAVQPKPEVTRIMNAWGEWVGSMGRARKDSGAFKFGGKTVSKDGVENADNLLTGYAIIDADNFDEALSMVAKAPNVVSGSGSMDVYEAFGLE